MNYYNKILIESYFSIYCVFALCLYVFSLGLNLGLHFLWLVSLLCHWLRFCACSFLCSWQTNYPHHLRLKVWIVIVTQNGGMCLIDLAPPHHKPQDCPTPKSPTWHSWSHNFQICVQLNLLSHHPPLHKHSCPNQRCNMGKMGWSGER
jgi:hypothetical protein